MYSTCVWQIDDMTPLLQGDLTTQDENNLKDQDIL